MIIILWQSMKDLVIEPSDALLSRGHLVVDAIRSLE